MADKKDKTLAVSVVATYLFLELEGDASDGSLLDSLHQVGGEAGDLVSKSLCLDLTDVIDDSLVHMEVVGQPIDKEADTPQVSLARDAAAASLTFHSTSQ